MSYQSAFQPTAMSLDTVKPTKFYFVICNYFLFLKRMIKPKAYRYFYFYFYFYFTSRPGLLLLTSN
jgi:hypothetical protein